MINSMQGTWFWAISQAQFTWTVTFYMPVSNVIAEATLSKVSGNGSAMSYIHHYNFFDQGSNTFRTISWAGAPDRAPAFQYIAGTPSVTFGLSVTNMYAYASAKLYFL